MNATVNPAHGAELYSSCVVCHEPAARPRSSRVPRLEGQHFSVLVKELIDYRQWQRWNESMERVTDPHQMDLQSVADVAAYASQIVPPRSPAWTRPASSEPGALIYARRCRSCHGVDGAGDAKAVIPRIGGQHYDYLVWQFYDVVHGHRQNLPRHHLKTLGKLQLDEILDVADFLSRSSPGSVDADATH